MSKDKDILCYIFKNDVNVCKFVNNIIDENNDNYIISTTSKNCDVVDITKYYLNKNKMIETCESDKVDNSYLIVIQGNSKSILTCVGLLIEKRIIFFISMRGSITKKSWLKLESKLKQYKLFNYKYFDTESDLVNLKEVILLMAFTYDLLVDFDKILDEVLLYITMFLEGDYVLIIQSPSDIKILNNMNGVDAIKIYDCVDLIKFSNNDKLLNNDTDKSCETIREMYVGEILNINRKTLKISKIE